MNRLRAILKGSRRICCMGSSAGLASTSASPSTIEHSGWVTPVPALVGKSMGPLMIITPACMTTEWRGLLEAARGKLMYSFLHDT